MKSLKEIQSFELWAYDWCRRDSYYIKKSLETALVVLLVVFHFYLASLKLCGNYFLYNIIAPSKTFYLKWLISSLVDTGRN